MAPPVGLAVFGAGRIGVVHARNVAGHVRETQLVGVADIDRSAAQRLVEELGTGRVDDAESFLADPLVSGVIIATPTPSHADLIAKAAQSGKHVLCEKPISLSLSVSEQALRQADEAKIILQVGFQRRFDADFSRARKHITQGDLGSLRLLRLVARDHRIPSIAYLRTSGGQYRDQMIHEFDLARWLFSPREVDEVFAAGSALIDPALAGFGDVDTALAMLRFDDGTLCIIDSSREAIYGYDVRAEIFGSKGMLLVDHRRLPSGAVLDRESATVDADSFIERFAEAYRAEVAEFVTAIRERRVARVGARDAVEALRIALAADRSLRQNRPVKTADVTDD